MAPLLAVALPAPAWLLYRDSRPHAAIGLFKYAIGYLGALFIALFVDHYLLLSL